jgi:hypothetical protein
MLRENMVSKFGEALLCLEYCFGIFVVYLESPVAA